LWLTRPDPQWHAQKRQEFLDQENVYAAALHQSWEQRAHGIVAFEKGEFDKSFAHLIAGVALTPAPPLQPETKPLPEK
jgi:hypothetical protein